MTACDDRLGGFVVVLVGPCGARLLERVGFRYVGRNRRHVVIAIVRVGRLLLLQGVGFGLIESDLRHVTFRFVVLRIDVVWLSGSAHRPSTSAFSTAWYRADINSHRYGA